MPGIGCTVKMDWFGDQVKAAVKAAIRPTLFDAGEFLLEEANKLVPFDKGNLKSTGKVHVVKGKLQIRLTYGGIYGEKNYPRVFVWYAAWLHEHPGFMFKNGREGKWLEKTFNAHGRTALEMVRDKF